jgi:hypothetical protein
LAGGRWRRQHWVAQAGGGIGEVVFDAVEALVRVPVKVGADQAGQQLKAGADHVAEGQGAAWFGSHSLRDPDRVIEVVEYLGDQAREDSASLGQVHRPRRSLEKGDLKLPFKILDGLA